MKRNLTIWMSLMILISILLTACGGGANETSAPEQPTQAPVTEAESTPVDSGTEGMLPEVNPLEVSGNIVTAGSSTVFPLAEAMAERFEDEGYSGNITIDSIGSGAGFERFCVAGETDIANASRPIRESEMENCRSIDREPIEFRIGTDALALSLIHI